MQLRNFLIIIGAAVGAGIFALPPTLVNTGYVPFALLLVGIAIAMGWVNYGYYQVVARSTSRHQLPGYVLRTLGSRWSVVASVLLLGSTVGALLAYLSLGGQFIDNLINTPSPLGTGIFFIAIAVPFLAMGRSLELWDYVFSTLKIVLYVVLIIVGIAVIIPGNPSLATSREAYAPYILYGFGPILFSLTAFSIVPELKRTPQGVSKTIAYAQISMSVLYLLFALLFAGVILGDGFITINGWLRRLLDGVGLISVYTPSLMFSWVGYDLFTKDLGFKPFHAKLMIIAIPLLLFVMGMSQFSLIIGVTGGIFLAAIGMLIMEMYHVVFPVKHALAVRLLQSIFFFSICLELLLLFSP